MESQTAEHTHIYKATGVPHGCLSNEYTMPSPTIAASEVPMHRTVGIKDQDLVASASSLCLVSGVQEIYITKIYITFSYEYITKSSSEKGKKEANCGT